MPEDSGSKVKAFAQSETQLRCVFPQGTRLHQSAAGELKVTVVGGGFLPSAGSHDVLLEICGGLGRMIDDIDDVLIRQFHHLFITVFEADAFDRVLSCVAEACICGGFRFTFDRYALDNILGAGHRELALR